MANARLDQSEEHLNYLFKLFQNKKVQEFRCKDKIKEIKVEEKRDKLRRTIKMSMSHIRPQDPFFRGHLRS